MLTRKVASLAAEAVITITQSVQTDAVHALVHLGMAVVYIRAQRCNR